MNGNRLKFFILAPDSFRLASLICALAFLLSAGIGLAGSSTPTSEKAVELAFPADRAVLPEDTLSFRWRVSPALDTTAHHYEITFWSTARIFRKRISVFSRHGQGGASYLMPSVRSEFKKHGRYFWRVAAVDSLGRQTQSAIRSFSIPRPPLSDYLSAWYFPCEIRFGMTHRVRSADYREFLDRLSPSTHLDSYGDIGLFFNQPGAFGLPGEIEEWFYALSSVGLGTDWGYRFSLYQNGYVSLSPEIRGGLAWFSTGLRQFSSLQYYGYIGGNCEILPKSYVTLFGGWMPRYRVRYAETGGGIRTFLGEGWQWGIRTLIPHSMIPVFRIAGVEIDFERIPIEFSIGHIRDEYTDVVMKNHCLGVGYLFR